MPTDLSQAKGPIAAADAKLRRGSIQIIHFSIQGSPRRFSYPSTLPRMEDAWSRLELGAAAEVLYTDKDPDSEGVELWGLRVAGRSLLEPAEAYSARRENGYWSLALGIAFTFGAGYLWLTARKVSE